MRYVPDDTARIAYAMADVFRDRAAELDMPQREVARRAGLTQPRISRVFAHGVALTFDVALSLCAALEIDLDVAYEEARRRAAGRGRQR